MENSVKKAGLSRFIAMFEEAERATLGATDAMRRARRYYNGDQLSAEELAELSRRGQPAVVGNLIRKKINWLRGYEMQSKTDPRAFPRTPAEAELAEAATDSLRYVADSTKYDRIRSKVWDNLVVEGIAGAEVVHEMGADGQPRIVINRYASSRLFYDPHSMEDDFSDARYKGAVIWSDMDDLLEEYPDKEDEIEGSITSDDLNQMYDDRPNHVVWTDPKRRRCRVVLVYYREGGVWKWAKFTRGGVLEDGESPYTNEYGESECPLIMQSMYVDEDDNTRHGVVKDYLDPQDESNKRRSKLLHMLNSRQTWGIKGAVGSVDAMKRELAKPNGHVEVTEEAAVAAAAAGVAPFNIIQNADQAAGQMQLLSESRAMIEDIGANSALMGQGSAKSGRQVMAQQQGGLVEIAPVYAQLMNFDDMIYRQMWMRVRQLWTEEKWIRVTDNEKNTRFVGLNRKVTLQEVLQEYSQEEVAMFARQYGLGPNDPRLQMVVRVENSVASMDVDIVIGEAPDAITLQGETFEQLVNLASSMPGSVPPDILIETAPNIDREVKDKLLERMEQQSSAGQEGQQAQMQLELAEKQAEIQKTNSEAQENEANAMRYMVEAQRSQMGF